MIGVFRDLNYFMELYTAPFYIFKREIFLKLLFRLDSIAEM